MRSIVRWFSKWLLRSKIRQLQKAKWEIRTADLSGYVSSREEMLDAADRLIAELEQKLQRY